jgi:hypothetical protein
MANHVTDRRSDDEGTVYYKNSDTFKVTPHHHADLKAAQDSLKRIAAANQTDSLKQALTNQNEPGIGTHRKTGTVKSGYSTIKRRSRRQYHTCVTIFSSTRSNHPPYIEWVPPALDKAVLRFVVKCPTQYGQHVILIGRYVPEHCLTR